MRASQDAAVLARQVEALDKVVARARGESLLERGGVLVVEGGRSHRVAPNRSVFQNAENASPAGIFTAQKFTAPARARRAKKCEKRL